MQVLSMIITAIDITIEFLRAISYHRSNKYSRIYIRVDVETVCVC